MSVKHYGASAQVVRQAEVRFMYDCMVMVRSSSVANAQAVRQAFDS